jgi:hypothetical protein
MKVASHCRRSVKGRGGDKPLQRVISDTMKSRHDARRATEVAIAVKSLNRMNEFGRAKFVRMA